MDEPALQAALDEVTAQLDAAVEKFRTDHPGIAGRTGDWERPKVVKLALAIATHEAQTGKPAPEMFLEEQWMTVRGMDFPVTESVAQQAAWMLPPWIVARWAMGFDPFMGGMKVDRFSGMEMPFLAIGIPAVISMFNRAKGTVGALKLLQAGAAANQSWAAATASMGTASKALAFLPGTTQHQLVKNTLTNLSRSGAVEAAAGGAALSKMTGGSGLINGITKALGGPGSKGIIGSTVSTLGRFKWPLIGVAAAVAGFVALSMFTGGKSDPAAAPAEGTAAPGAETGAPATADAAAAGGMAPEAAAPMGNGTADPAVQTPGG